MKHVRLIVGAIAILALLGTVASCAKPETTDIVIIGAGGAGLSAAVTAHDAGAQVIVVEKMPMVGGNTNYATGGINAAGTQFQAALGIEDSPELFYQDTMTGGKNINDSALVRRLSTEAAVSVDWLTSLGADLSDVGRLGGHSVNRSHRPTGGAPVGNHIVQTLKAAADERGIDIRTWTQAVEILQEDGKPVGVRVYNSDEDKEYEIRAAVVVMTAGGFGANPEMVVSYDPSLAGFGTTNHPGATGDAIPMAQAIGADLVDIEYIQTHPTVVPNNGTMITEAVRGNGAILVNRDAQRFIGELLTRDVVSAAELEQEGKTAYLLFDQGVRDSLSAIEKYISAGLVTQAPDVATLASDLGLDPSALTATLERYNGFVESGVDPDFSRTSMARPITTAPYYAVEVGPAVHHTMGGIKIDTEARVIDTDGNVIEGFYAAGECTGGVHGANRLGGNALADIVTYGRIAGANAAAFAEAAQ